MNVFDSLITAQFNGVSEFLKAEAAQYKIPVSQIAYIALINEGRLLTGLVKDRTVLRPLPLGNLALKVFKEELDPDKLERITKLIRSLIAGTANDHELTEANVVMVIRTEDDDNPTIWLQHQANRLEQIPTVEFARMMYHA